MSVHDPERGPAEPGDVLRGFLRRGEAFIEEILQENESLRLRVVQLESTLHETRSPVPAPAAAEELRTIFEQLRKEHEELHRRLDQVAQETETYKARYQEIEEENDRLVNLFVSSHQIHSTLDLSDAIQIMLEILLNFVGAGRFAILLIDSEAHRLRTLASYGLPEGESPEYALTASAMEACLTSRKVEVWESDESGSWGLDRPVAAIPLLLGREVIGAVAIYSYLEQKESLSPIDQEIFSLLSEQGGVVLESARLAGSVLVEVNRYAACRHLIESREDPNA